MPSYGYPLSYAGGRHSEYAGASERSSDAFGSDCRQEPTKKRLPLDTDVESSDVSGRVSTSIGVGSHSIRAQILRAA